MAIYAESKLDQDNLVEIIQEDNKAENDRKKKYREANFPGNDKDLENNSDWRETTHPNQKQAGHREFENIKTGEKLRFDKGDPMSQGHEFNDHYHRYNPNSTGRHNQYLDNEGNPTRRGADNSHLYPPEGIYWNFN